MPRASGSPLSREALARHAVGIADKEGLAAVTIRRLAKDNGVTAMALYWHFDDKQALLDAITNQVLSEVTIPARGKRTWESQLEHILVELSQTLRRHQACAPLILPRIFAVPAAIALSEHVLAVLDESGLSVERAAETGRLLVCSVITLVIAGPGSDALTQDEKLAASRRQHDTLAALPADEFPHMIAAAKAITALQDDDAYYRRGIELLVTGTKAQVA